jgi:hypothetical protein
MFFGGDPFEQFGGGQPGGGGGGRRPRGPVDNDKLYEILGVAKDADESEIKKAFKKLALKNHPDKGGDAEKVSDPPPLLTVSSSSHNLFSVPTFVLLSSRKLAALRKSFWTLKDASCTTSMEWKVWRVLVVRMASRQKTSFPCSSVVDAAVGALDRSEEKTLSTPSKYLWRICTTARPIVWLLREISHAKTARAEAAKSGQRKFALTAMAEEFALLFVRLVPEWFSKCKLPVTRAVELERS